MGAGGRYPPPLLHAARTFLGAYAPRLPGPLTQPFASAPSVAIQGQLEQGGADRAVYLPVDPPWPPSALECRDRLVPVGDVVAEAPQREVERPVIVERI